MVFLGSAVRSGSASASPSVSKYDRVLRGDSGEKDGNEVSDLSEAAMELAELDT
jgi:hypothetical protein